MPKSAVKPSLELSISALCGEMLVPILRKHLPMAALLAGSPLRELSVVLAGDALISKLHQRFFHDPATTDVITFPLDTDARGRALSGEIYLCVPEARRQAKERRIPVAHELLLYGIHGILHLAGHDDLNEAGYRKMHKLEDHILQELGIGVIFAHQTPVKAATSGRRK